MSFLRSVSTIGIFTLASRITGFIRDMLITSIVGAGAIYDAFIVAFKLPNFFRRLFAEGAFNAAFIPLFSEINIKKGHDKAFEFANNVFLIMLIALTAFSALFIFCMPWVVRINAPGFISTPERLQMAIDFGRIAFPYILFISLSALLSGVLNALHRFSAAAFAPVILNIVMILAVVSSYFINSSIGLLLVYGVAIAGVLQLLFLLIAAQKAGYRFKFTIP